MRNYLLTAALILAVGLAAAGCGPRNAGTSAYRWNAPDNAEIQQDLARGAPEGHDGHYYADGDGRVKGFRENRPSEHTEEDLKKAGEDLMRGARDAGESIGRTTERALDRMTGTANTGTG